MKLLEAHHAYAFYPVSPRMSGPWEAAAGSYENFRVSALTGLCDFTSCPASVRTTALWVFVPSK